MRSAEIKTIRAQLRDAGALPAHAHRALRLWSHALPQTTGKRRIEDFLPRSLQSALPGRLESLEAGADDFSSNMGHLRRKLEADPAQPEHFLTETGVGYRFVAGRGDPSGSAVDG